MALELIEQPKPPFTLLDLEAKLTELYDTLQVMAKRPDESHTGRVVAMNGTIHELLAKVTWAKDHNESIEMPIDVAKAVTDAIGTEHKVEFTVSGVQLIEYEKLVGTSLYSTVIKARNIRDILNARFAELRVNHVAKIINYPVY